ncbi:1,4-dihydroxy-2-naphthoate octaprenyltransferase [Flavobacterium sp.]|uniref:1,4-dihydroxy-2-naphthoate octaprenyltransferase n=1 Tax=Flavobacterium sp. TaxID=239 RepID=UPI003753D8CF
MKHWIQAARLRTLPLSVSGILVGSFYAFANQTNVISEISNWIIFGFSLLTTLGFQVLSNFANDYGDGVKGTDNEHRIGPMRAIQSGKISVESMKKAIIITSVLTLISASVLIYFAFKNTNFGYSLFFLLLGIVAIIAAVKYTVGNSAYGYKGFGDVFVFIFFGLVSTLGVNFLYSKQIDLQLILPACAIGLLSVGVLNLNNMRDEVSDRNSNKNTIVVKMGGKKAKVYHYILIISAMLITLIFAIIYNGTGFRISQYAFLVAYFPLISHIKTVYYCSEPRNLDPELKKLAISTFLLSVILSIVMLF